MTRYRFGGHTVDTDTVEVSGPDGPKAFEPQVYDVLVYLIEQQGRLVTKEELLDNVWGDRFISESALTTRIKQARRLVGDDGRTQWAIKTVHGRGYRFVADAVADDPAGSPGSPADDDGASPAGDAEAAPAAAPDRVGADGIPAELAADIRHLFVGREEEIAAAAGFLSRPGAHPVRWIWLLGEPGIGKTRAAAEMAQRANRDGHRVLFGRNSEDLNVPFQPIIEALRMAIDGLPADDLAAELGQGAGHLIRLVPELADRIPPADDPAAPLDDNTRRYRLMEAIADWLATSAARRPTLLVVDDLQWASDSTLQFLAHLQQRPQPCALTVVATARDTAPDDNPRVADLVAGAPGPDRTLQLRLSGLSDDAAQRLLGESTDLGTAMRQTAGNPLLLQAINPDDPSIDLRAAIRRRLARLAEPVQQVLSLAAVIGLEFDLKIVAAAAGRSELDVLDDVEAALAARLLDDVGADRFRFTHALVRSSLRDDISSGRRARWHAAVAAAIESIFDTDRAQVPALAHHTAEAAVADPSLRPDAVARLRRAAELAVDQLSFAEAIDHLQRARGLADPADRALHAELALAQGDVEARHGSSSLAIRSYDSAITDARRSGRAELLAMAAICYTSVSWRPGRGDAATLDRTTEALAALDRAVADGRDIPDEAWLRAHLHIGKVRAHAMIGQFDRTDAAYAEARGHIDPLDDEGLEAELLTAYLSDLRSIEQRTETIALLDRLAAIHHRIQDRETMLLSLQVRLHYELYSGRLVEHRALEAEFRSQSQATGSLFWIHIAANDEAMLAFYDGDLARTEELAEHCLELADRLPDEDGSGAYGLRMFAVRREQDRLAGLTPLVRHLVDGRPADALWAPGLALLSAETGDLDEARALMAGFRDRRFALPLDAMWSTVMALLVETAVAVGDVESCAELRNRFAPMRGMSVVTGHGILCLGAVDRYLGMATLALGDVAGAETCFGSALEIDSRGGSVLWANHDRLWLARALRADGRTDEARAVAGVVAGEAEAAGLTRLSRLAAAELDAR